MHFDWLEFTTSLATSNQSALFQGRIITLLWNNALLFVTIHHMTSNIQWKCFISEKNNDPNIIFLYQNWPCSILTYKPRMPILGESSPLFHVPRVDEESNTEIFSCLKSISVDLKCFIYLNKIHCLKCIPFIFKRYSHLKLFQQSKNVSVDFKVLVIFKIVSFLKMIQSFKKFQLSLKSWLTQNVPLV